MLYNCVMLGDLSPFSSCMTKADSIFFNVALHEKQKLETERQFIMLDVRFYLSIMANLTPEGAKFIPSYVHALEQNLSDEE